MEDLNEDVKEHIVVVEINGKKYELHCPIIDGVVCYPDGEHIPWEIYEDVLIAEMSGEKWIVEGLGNGNFRFISTEKEYDKKR